MDDPRELPRYGNNNPLYSQAAAWDGHRSVRLAVENLGFSTTVYSYGLGYDELTEAAERIALLWNLHLGQTNVELRAALSAKVEGGCDQ
ncbi:hypothetical protein [Rhizobium lusitanum]|uniref:Uncharacterized protein n=1 Tax=Rhizobium lusitanum TaxID=293958 RepID=A0A7X0MFA2_9HYPH|nr:hypothetical protein [Rhizobium lusitanum]MBB6488767.1 hypothetical protein [Rhizobium lusitanum]